MSGNVSGVRGFGDDTLEALVEVMFLAASADGEFSSVERDHFFKSVESLTDGRIPTPRLEALMLDAKRALEREGREARLKTVKARLPEAGARRVALSLAIQVTAADGIIRTSERELIQDVVDALELDPEEAANLVRSLSR